ncbi:MAG TPA: ABC transporter substrate-binding protein, partial [Burkholderiaceae bacterium]|nr:ABC transporter substrate-binding protein [Burkholderiaceae bacterium]
SLYGFSHFSGAMWLAKAMERVGANVEARDKFLDAVLSSELSDSPLGRPVRLDAYGNPIYDIFIRRVEKNKDGKYWNVPIETYPNVSQFWKYDPKEYLKQPPYSRTFQGIKQK